MFIVAEKNRPNSFYMDKASFAKLTANADHHVVDNVKVGMRLTAASKVSHPPTQEPLGTPTMNFKSEKQSAGQGQKDDERLQPVGKESPLGSPTMNFSEQTN